MTGTRRAWAMALAVAMPTRMPVNRPGPTSTAMAPISPSVTSAWPAHELDGRRQRLGVAAPAGHLEQAEHALVATDARS